MNPLIFCNGRFRALIGRRARSVLRVWALFGLTLVAAPVSAAVTAALTPTEDAFARQLAPTNNFGGGGAVAVSGANSVNGQSQARGRVDTLLKFNTAAAKTSFDAAYGAGNWTITAATLRVVEVGAPTNALFARGAGGFSLAWLSDDNWSEGSGTPQTPTVATGNQLSWNSLQTLVSGGTENALGGFSSLGADGSLALPLGLPAGFVGDAAAGGFVTLHAAPTTDTIGLTFNSRSNSTSELRPVLELTAAPEPGGAMVLVVALMAVRYARPGPRR